MEKSTKMVEEITKKRKMTSAVKANLNKRIFYNCLVAIGMMLYIGIMNLVYLYAKSEVAEILFRVFPMIFLLITIGIFEFAYWLDSGKMAILGIECLVLSIIFLYIPKIYENLQHKLCAQLAFIPIFCAIYYVGKCILIYLKTQKDYQNSLSDVKEIVKEEISV